MISKSPSRQVNRSARRTCFVLEMWDQWLLVTAGHVLLEHLYSPDCEHVTCSIYDAWKKGASQHPIPFPLPEMRFALDEDGLDLGLTPVDGFFRRLMEANGVRAFRSASVAPPAPGRATARHRGLARPVHHATASPTPATSLCWRTRRSCPSMRSILPLEC